MAEVKEILPCVADPSKFRVIGRIEVDVDLDKVMPFLARLIFNSSYNEKYGWITFKRGPSIITIHNDRFVAMTQIKDESEALAILRDIEEKVREAWNNRDKIDLSRPAKMKVIGPLDVYNYLPKTNCKKCGEQTCMAFAIKLLNGEKKLEDCKPLFDNSEARKTLVSLLNAAGYF